MILILNFLLRLALFIVWSIICWEILILWLRVDADAWERRKNSLIPLTPSNAWLALFFKVENPPVPGRMIPLMLIIWILGGGAVLVVGR